MDKGWDLATQNNMLAAAYDEGCVIISVGNDKPLASCSKGKLMWTTNNEVFSTNIKAVVTKNVANFEDLTLNVKEHTGLEIFPQKLIHSPNG